MTLAQTVVRRLLEMLPYDIDDPLDKPEFPQGFTATLPESAAEQVEMRFDQKISAYRFTRSYYDPTIIHFDGDRDTGQRGKRISAGAIRTIPLHQAAEWLEREAEKWRNSGWQVTML